MGCRLWGRHGGIWDAPGTHGAPDPLRGAHVLLGEQPCKGGESWHPRGLGHHRGGPRVVPAPTCIGSARGGRAGDGQRCGAGAEGSPRGGLGSLQPRWPGGRRVPGSGVAERGPARAPLVGRQCPGPRLSPALLGHLGHQPPGRGPPAPRLRQQQWDRAGQSRGGAGGAPCIPSPAHRLHGARAGVGTLCWPRAHGLGDRGSAGGAPQLLHFPSGARGRWLSPCVRLRCPRPGPP